MTNPTPDQDLQEELALLPDELDELGEMEVEEAGTPVTFDPDLELQEEDFFSGEVEEAGLMLIVDPDLERPHTNQPPKTETP